jgi:two-component system nitrogen regulation sensor histidine kinase GlnL
MPAKSRTARVRRLQPQWEEIFSSLGDGLAVLDKEMKLIGINPAAERITGLSAESVLGHSLQKAFPENQKVLELLSPSFEDGRALTLRQMPWKIRYGKQAFLDLSITSLFGENGDLNGWILALRDITPIKNLEEEIRQSDRLAMMGTIAAGLAHEIKNPLGGIKGAAQLLRRVHTSPESEECLGIIIRESERVDRLVNELLTFSRPKTLNMEPVNLNQLIDSVLLLQKGLLDKKKISVRREYDPSLPPILGDQDELHKVFLNFIKNAIEALPDSGGELKCRSRLLTDFKIKEGNKASLMAMAEIQDNGSGIAPDNLDKIFTPFFTTKEKGHGLGMAISQRVITEHGGSVHVTSEQGRGATIQVFLRSCL